MPLCIAKEQPQIVKVRSIRQHHHRRRSIEHAVFRECLRSGYNIFHRQVLRITVRLRFCDLFRGPVVTDDDGTFAGHQSRKKAVPGADIQNPLFEAAQLVHDGWKLQSVPKRVSRDVGCILRNFSEVGDGLFFELQH